MLIGHFLSHYPQPGGTTTMVNGLGRALQELGHDVVVFSSDRPNSVETNPAHPELPMVRLPVPGNGRAVLGPRFPVPVPPQIDQLTALDVLVVHAAFAPPSALVASWSDRRGVPYVRCPHDPYSREMFQTHRLRKSVYWEVVEKPGLSRARAVHLLAPSHAQHLSSRGVTTPWFAFPNGVVAYQDPESSSSNPTHNRLRLLYLGRIDIHNKGIDLLLSAVARIQARGVPVVLTLAGRASSRDESRLGRLVRSSRVNDTQLLGYVKDVREVILSHDVVVLPSRFDGFGQVVIESLALGRPAIVSTHAGVSEYLDRYHRAVLVTRPTVGDLETAIEQAAGRLDEMRRAAFQQVSELRKEFAWNRIAEAWAQSLAKTIDS